MKISVEVQLSFGGLTTAKKVFTMTLPVQPGQGLPNAQAALTALQANVATFIADSATAIQNALASAQNPGDSPVTIPPVTVPPVVIPPVVG
jgi:hypothetical protein